MILGIAETIKARLLRIAVAARPGHFLRHQGAIRQAELRRFPFTGRAVSENKNIQDKDGTFIGQICHIEAA